MRKSIKNEGTINVPNPSSEKHLPVSTHIQPMKHLLLLSHGAAGTPLLTACCFHLCNRSFSEGDLPTTRTLLSSYLSPDSVLLQHFPPEWFCFSFSLPCFYLRPKCCCLHTRVKKLSYNLFLPQLWQPSSISPWHYLLTGVFVYLFVIYLFFSDQCF